MEDWLDINDYEGKYQVSSSGNIRSINYNNTNRCQNLISRINRGGRKYINLSKNGKYTSYVISRLVAIAFIPNPKNLPEVNHIEGNKLNDSKDNLEWSSREDNIKHAHINNLYPVGENHSKSILTDKDIENIRLLHNRVNLKYVDISNLYGVSRQHIRAIILNKKRKLRVGGIEFPPVS